MTIFSFGGSHTRTAPAGSLSREKPWRSALALTPGVFQNPPSDILAVLDRDTGLIFLLEGIPAAGTGRPKPAWLRSYGSARSSSHLMIPAGSNACDAKRHQAVYDSTGSVSEQESDNAVKKGEALLHRKEPNNRAERQDTELSLYGSADRAFTFITLQDQ